MEQRIELPEKRNGLGHSATAFFALAALVLLGFLFRVDGLGTQSLWHDEAFSVDLASADLLAVTARAAADTHPPLYFWLLSLWMPVAGKGEFALRFLSVLAAALTVPAAYAVARRCLGTPAGLLTAALSALSPFYVYYAQETRGYALLALATVLSAYAMLRLLDRPTWRWVVAYVAATSAALYTHYYGLTVVLFEDILLLLVVAVHCRGRRLWQASFPRLWLAGQVAIAILYLPWAWDNAYRLQDYTSQTKEALNAASYFWQIVIPFGLGHSVERINVAPGDPGNLADHQRALLLSLVLLAAVALGALATLRPSDWSAADDAPAASPLAVSLSCWLAISWLLIPAIAVYVLSVGRRDFTGRYLIASAPAYYMLMAAGILSLRRAGRRAPIAGSAIAFLILGYSLWNYAADPKYARDDQRGAVAYVEQHAMPDEAVILNAGYSYPAFTYYYRGQAPWYGLPEQYPLDRTLTARRLQELGERYDYLWLVLWQDYFSDPDHFVETFLDERYTRNRAEAFHGNVKVRGYLTRSPLLHGEPPGIRRLDRRIGDQVVLLGCKLDRDVARAGEELTFTLYWQALQQLPKDYTVFVHLVNPAQQVVAQADGPPVYGHLPASRWPVGSIVQDERRLSVPAYTPPGDYALIVGLYDPITLERLGTGGADRVRIEPVPVARGNPAAIPHRLGLLFDGKIELAGYDFKGEGRPGGSLHVDLFWRAQAPIGDDLTVFVHLLDGQGTRRGQDDAKPARGSYPTTAWLPGEIIRDRHDLSVPADASPGQYAVAVGLYDAASGHRLTYRTWPWSRQETSALLQLVSSVP